MADDDLPPARGSRLKPRTTDHLALASPPRGQNPTQSTCKRSKRTSTRPRRPLEQRDRVASSSRRGPRAIFNEETKEQTTLQDGEATEDINSSLLTQNSTSDEQLRTSEQDTIDQVKHNVALSPFKITPSQVDDRPHTSQDRKRAAGTGANQSPLSCLKHDTIVGRKKWKGGLREITSAQESYEASFSCQIREETGGIDGQKTVLKRAVSSQTVLMSRGLSSPLPSSTPTLKRCHLSEVTASSVDVALRPILPTVYSSRHPDLNVITPETVVKVLRGEFEEQLAGFELLDCRFLFEFEGGSLRGASSLCDPETMEMRFFKSMALEDCTRTALIFFCEFSANRAPKMLRHLRNVDRRLHADRYPELFYPELYLIDGGYKNCFETLQREICAPPVAYVPMDDKRFADSCRLEFAAWRRRWKPHKVIGNCTAKFQQPSRPQLQGKLLRAHVQDQMTVSHGVRSLFDDLYG